MSSISPTNPAGAYGALRLARAYASARVPGPTPPAPINTAQTNPAAALQANSVQPSDRAAGVRDVASLTPTSAPDTVGRIIPRPSATPTSARGLVAALVPGRIDFSGDEPVQARPGAMPIYRHPADKNAAATGIHAGRLIDTEA